MDFRILGPLEVWHEGGAIRVTGDRQRALLAILLLHAREVVSVDRLMDDLWGATPPSAGATALRVCVARLRKALRDHGGLLSARAHGYVLQVEPGRLDLHCFESLLAEGERALAGGDALLAADRLHAALAVWRGPPLADFTYASFARAAIVRLEELRLAAVELRIAADLALGRSSAVVGELETLVAEHPLRERFCSQLMLALYRAGRQADALAAYQATRRRLVEEVGIEPERQLQALERRILAQDPALDVDEPPVPRPRSILVLPESDAALEALAGFAEPLARHGGDELLIAMLVGSGDELAAATARVHAVRERAVARGATARGAAFVSDDRGDDVVRLVAGQDVELLVLDATRALLASGSPTADLGAVLAGAACDVALVAGRDAPAAEAGSGAILVPFAGHDHDWAAVELAAWQAGARGAPLRLLGTRGDPGAGRRDASRLLAHASLALQRGLSVTAEPTLVAPGARGIGAAAHDAALVVVGLSDRWAGEGLGATRLAIARDARPPVVLVRRGVRPGGLAPPEALTRFTWSAG
jgi:DNA-binding SARP family transcriptional activator